MKILFFIMLWLSIVLMCEICNLNIPRTDTLRIKSEGTGNRVKINDATVDGVNSDSLAVFFKGEIEQTGSNNHVDIQSEKPRKSKDSIKSKQTVIIKQTGKNNSVKINSR
jgi:hypothetical protein